MTLLSRILGLVRDIVVANYFGARADAFFVAFKIPNFFRRLFAEGAFSVAFVPVLSEYRTKRDLSEIQALVGAVLGSLGLSLGIITAIAVVGAPVLAMIFAPGFMQDPEKMALTADMLRITFPYLMLISLTAFYGSVLNSYGEFAVPAFTPVLLNISLIVSALWLSPMLEEPIMALAWGVLVAGFIQLLFQMPFVARKKLLVIPVYRPKDEGVVRIIKLMIPALFGVSVSQINLLLDVLLASFLEAGSVTWLYYSDRLAQLPLGIFAIAIGVVILPSLSRKFAEDNPDNFASTIDWAVRMVMLIGVPAALAIGLLAEPLMATLFYHGEMTAYDIGKMAMSVQAYGFGLLAFMLIKVLAPGYYARQDTKTPVKIGIAAMVANMVLNLMLVFSLAHVGLALATAISAYFNAFLLFWGLKKSGHYQFDSSWKVYLLRMILANGALVGVLIWFSADASQWLQWSVWERAGQMTVLVIAGISVYLGVLVAAGFRLSHIKHSVE
jgi:putative peptidoglycan lipid II flippase